LDLFFYPDPVVGRKGAHLSNSFQELLFNVVFPHIIVKVGGKEHSNKKRKRKKRRAI
jgi:hypothetical protein